MARQVTRKNNSNSPQTSASRLTDDIFAIAGYWEPISFMKRGGRAYRGIDEDKYPYSKEMAEYLANVGISGVVWHYYKGLGIKTEEEEMQRTTEFFKHCEKVGLTRGAYINFGSFFADTFFVENPQYRDWPAMDQFGMPHQYSEFYRCYYRYRPCLTHTEYSDYVAKAAVKSIKKAGADIIMFDNSAQMPCYCEKCQKQFPEYLVEKYPVRPTDGKMSFKERFGYEFNGEFALPRGTARQPIDTMPTAHEPGFYEWIRYRQNLYERGMTNAVKQIREAGTGAKICWNIALDFGEFPGLVWGLDAETAYRSQSDFFFSEDENHAGMEDGRLIGHIRTYKYGRAMRNRVFVHNEFNDADNQWRLLNYAEAAAFNQGCIGTVMWATEPDDGRLDILKKSLNFFRANKHAYLKTLPVSSVVLYRCSESETMNWAGTTLSRYAIEQTLITSSIQYDCIINDNFDDVFKYKVLICPNSICVSDAIVEKIAEFVRCGGKVLCTELSFRKDEYGIKRIATADMGMIGERDSKLVAMATDTDISRILAYLGLSEKYAESIFYLSQLDFGRKFNWDPRLPAIPAIGKDYFAEPLNKDELLALVRRALPQSDIEIDGPENVIAGYFEAADGTRIIHLFDYQIRGAVSGVRVRCKIGSCRVSQAIFKSLESDLEVQVAVVGGYAEFIVPDFTTYGFVHLQTQK